MERPPCIEFKRVKFSSALVTNSDSYQLETCPGLYEYAVLVLGVGSQEKYTFFNKKGYESGMG